MHRVLIFFDSIRMYLVKQEDCSIQTWPSSLFILRRHYGHILTVFNPFHQIKSSRHNNIMALKLGITMLIHNKDDIEFVTEWVTWTFILCLYSYITFLSFYSKLFQELSYRFESPWPPAFYIQIVYFFELNSYSIGYYRSKCFIQHFKMYAWDYTHECRLYNRIKFDVLCVTLSSDQNLKKKWKKKIPMVV